MDPYKVLQLPKNFTMDQLKRHYRKLVIKYHHDLNVDIRSTPIFQALTEAYKMLQSEYLKKEKAAEHYQLKQTFVEQIKKPTGANKEFVAALKTSFDSNKFNELYEQHAYKDKVQSTGYGDWLKSDQDMDIKEKAIINYEEPKPLPSSKVVGRYTELGRENITDFSNLDGSGIPYMDLRVAHTTTRIVDDKMVEKRPVFKTMNDLEVHRSQLEYTMTPEQQREYALKMEKEKEYEQKRIKTLREQDGYIEKLYNNTHSLMLASCLRAT